jgi:cobalt transporter subunit CbtB
MIVSSTLARIGHSLSRRPALVRASATLTALAAAVLGAGLIYVAGFAEVPQVHNAAHDARHTAGFPCH